MALLAGNEGETLMLKRILGDQSIGDTTGDSLTLRLYDNNYTPVEGDSWLAFSESDGAGYGAVGIPGDTAGGFSGWTYDTAAGDTVSATYAQVTFTYSGGDTLYGYYVTTRDGFGDTTVLWAEEFTDGPYTIPSGGGTVKVTPKVQLD